MQGVVVLMAHNTVCVMITAHNAGSVVLIVYNAGCCCCDDGTQYKGCVVDGAQGRVSGVDSI